MYGVHVLLVPLGNKRARLGSLRVTGSDIHIQASITFVLTEVSSQVRRVKTCENRRVRLYQHLNEPMDGSFTVVLHFWIE